MQKTSAVYFAVASRPTPNCEKTSPLLFFDSPSFPSFELLKSAPHTNPFLKDNTGNNILSLLFHFHTPLTIHKELSTTIHTTQKFFLRLSNAICRSVVSIRDVRGARYYAVFWPGCNMVALQPQGNRPPEIIRSPACWKHVSYTLCPLTSY